MHDVHILSFIFHFFNICMKDSYMDHDTNVSCVIECLYNLLNHLLYSLLTGATMALKQ